MRTSIFLRDQLKQMTSCYSHTAMLSFPPVFQTRLEKSCSKHRAHRSTVVATTSRAYVPTSELDEFSSAMCFNSILVPQKVFVCIFSLMVYLHGYKTQRLSNSETALIWTPMRSKVPSFQGLKACKVGLGVGLAMCPA